MFQSTFTSEADAPVPFPLRARRMCVPFVRASHQAKPKAKPSQCLYSTGAIHRTGSAVSHSSTSTVEQPIGRSCQAALSGFSTRDTKYEVRMAQVRVLYCTVLVL